MSYPRLIFDIETVADHTKDYLLEDLTKIPKNIKNQDKIIAKNIEKINALREKMALDADLSTVTSIGCRSSEDSGLLIAHVVGDPETPTEKDLIMWFWDQLSQYENRCVGYNIMGFDLPYLLRRSFALRIKPQNPLLLSYYHSIEPVTDLMNILACWQVHEQKGLKWLAKCYNLEVLAPDKDGSQVEQMSLEERRLYVSSDVHITYQLWQLMNGYYFDL